MLTFSTNAYKRFRYLPAGSQGSPSAWTVMVAVAVLVGSLEKRSLWSAVGPIRTFLTLSLQ